MYENIPFSQEKHRIKKDLCNRSVKDTIASQWSIVHTISMSLFDNIETIIESVLKRPKWPNNIVDADLSYNDVILKS